MRDINPCIRVQIVEARKTSHHTNIMPRCDFCNVGFHDVASMRRHQTLASSCKKKLEKEQGALLQAARAQMRRQREETARQREANLQPRSHSPVDVELDISEPVDSVLQEADFHEDTRGPADSGDLPDCDACPPPAVEQTRLPQRSTTPFDPAAEAGAVYGKSKTPFERIRDEEILKGAEVLGPFKDDEEWELAKWLIKNVGHTQAESFLKLPIVRQLDIPHDQPRVAYHITSFGNRSKTEQLHPSTTRIPCCRTLTVSLALKVRIGNAKKSQSKGIFRTLKISQTQTTHRNRYVPSNTSSCGGGIPWSACVSC